MVGEKGGERGRMSLEVLRGGRGGGGGEGSNRQVSGSGVDRQRERSHEKEENLSKMNYFTHSSTVVEEY